MLRSSLILTCCLALNSCGVYKSYVRHKNPEAVEALRNKEFIHDEEEQKNLDVFKKQMEEEQELADLLRNQ